MKKIVKSFFIMILLFVCCISVNAQSSDVYFTNMNGATLTEEQYNYLINFFSEDTLKTMTTEQMDSVKYSKNLSKSSQIKYIKTDEFYDNNGNLIESKETEVSEKEALNFKSEVSPLAWNVTHQTSMKRLYMQVVNNGAIQSKLVTITNTWLSMPKVKSFDVIAVRPGSNSMTVNLNSNSMSGYQKWDGDIINYNSGSSHFKKSSSFTGNGGVGLSMNLVDATGSSLENSMTVLFISGAEPFKIYGTYQHATSDVSLSESQNYTFGNGYGGVLVFASSVASKYDKMQGVYLEYTTGEEYL